MKSTLIPKICNESIQPGDRVAMEVWVKRFPSESDAGTAVELEDWTAYFILASVYLLSKNKD